MKRFSKSFPTFFDWKNQASNSAYAKRITKLHYKYPDATLPKLIGRERLPRSKVPLHLVDPRGLTPRELALRNQSLHVLNRIRRGQTLDELDSYDASRNNLVKYLGDTITIKRNSIRAKKSDKIPRLMTIDEEGKEDSVIVTNSKDASIIGRYYNAKRQFLETGDPSKLKEFSKIKIKDADGNIRRLETDPDKIYEIEDRKEEPEAFEIYQS